MEGKKSSAEAVIPSYLPIGPRYAVASLLLPRGRPMEGAVSKLAKRAMIPSRKVAWEIKKMAGYAVRSQGLTEKVAQVPGLTPVKSRARSPALSGCGNPIRGERLWGTKDRRIQKSTT